MYSVFEGFLGGDGFPEEEDDADDDDGGGGGGCGGNEDNDGIGGVDRERRLGLLAFRCDDCGGGACRFRVAALASPCAPWACACSCADSDENGIANREVRCVV